MRHSPRRVLYGLVGGNVDFILTCLRWSYEDLMHWFHKETSICLVRHWFHEGTSICLRNWFHEKTSICQIWSKMNYLDHPQGTGHPL
jgi:hypothetical protein